MGEVEIEYCVPCGLLEPAVKVQTSLLEAYGQRLEGVRLRPGEGGVFKIRMDGELVWDEKLPELDMDDVRRRIGDRLGALPSS